MAKGWVTVVVAGDVLDHFDEVVSDAERAGLHVERELKDLGVMRGVIESARLARLKRVKGIARVERGRDCQIPPPASDVQ